MAVENDQGYTTINVYPEDRDAARKAKRGQESWSEFLRRAAEELGGDK